MMLAERYQELWSRMHDLREAWLELGITVREDVPRDGGAMPAERLADRVDDAVGALEEAVTAATALLQDRPRSGGAAPPLARIGARLAETSRIYWRDLAAYGPQAELGALARRRGPEWSAWVAGLRQAYAPLADLQDGTEAAWRAVLLDLVDQSSTAIEEAITASGDESSQGYQAEGQ
jgi:hypothetical protein